MLNEEYPHQCVQVSQTRKRVTISAHCFTSVSASSMLKSTFIMLLGDKHVVSLKASEFYYAENMGMEVEGCKCCKRPFQKGKSMIAKCVSSLILFKTRWIILKICRYFSEVSCERAKRVSLFLGGEPCNKQSQIRIT